MVELFFCNKNWTREQVCQNANYRNESEHFPNVLMWEGFRAVKKEIRLGVGGSEMEVYFMDQK